jgi:hypothetical protein
MMEFNRDFREIVKLLIDFEVKYMIVGLEDLYKEHKKVSGRSQDIADLDKLRD